MSRINPIGYQATTAQGNQYKKSNLGKTLSVLVLGGFDVAINTVPKLKNSKYGQLSSLDNFLKELGKTIGKEIKLSKGAMKALKIGTYVVDFFLALGIGALIDKGINKHRAKKADRIANA